MKPAASAWRVRATVRSMPCSGLSVNPNSINRQPQAAEPATSTWSQRSLTAVEAELAEAVRLRSDQVVVGVRPAITEELPRLADLGDLVEVHVADHQLLVMGRPEVADELAARVAEVALAVEVVVADLGLDADTIDRPDEVAVRDGMRHLFDAPEVFT